MIPTCKPKSDKKASAMAICLVTNVSAAEMVEHALLQIGQARSRQLLAKVPVGDLFSYNMTST